MTINSITLVMQERVYGELKRIEKLGYISLYEEELKKIRNKFNKKGIIQLYKIENNKVMNEMRSWDLKSDGYISTGSGCERMYMKFENTHVSFVKPSQYLYYLEFNNEY